MPEVDVAWVPGDPIYQVRNHNGGAHELIEVDLDHRCEKYGEGGCWLPDVMVVHPNEDEGPLWPWLTLRRTA